MNPRQHYVKCMDEINELPKFVSVGWHAFDFDEVERLVYMFEDHGMPLLIPPCYGKNTIADTLLFYSEF